MLAAETSLRLGLMELRADGWYIGNIKLTEASLKKIEQVDIIRMAERQKELTEFGGIR